MSIGYWEVIHSEDGKRFACQRTPLTGDAEFETTEWLSDVSAVEQLCDLLNCHVPHEIAALPDHLRPS